MINVGIDAGVRYIKTVVLQDGNLKGLNFVSTGEDIIGQCENSIENMGFNLNSVDNVFVTGLGSSLFKEERYSKLSVVKADAKGVNFIDSNVGTVIDIGAEETRVVICEKGFVKDFLINESCAAGTGLFMESMSRVLETSIDELGQIALTSDHNEEINAQCVVFAESEVISLIHEGLEKKDIARSVILSIVRRIVSMVQRMNYRENVMLIGGLANNVGFQKIFSELLNCKLLVPENYQYITAIGAALNGKG